MEDRIAIIDLGSNSARMIIMKILENGSFKMIDQAKEMVRLSEGMSQDNYLKPVAVNRTIGALKLFKKFIDSYEVENIVAIATAGVRNAINGGPFIDKVKTETGFDFDVISGEMEAHYDYIGVINTIAVDDCVILDIGGGSTEIILVEGRRIKNSISIPYGAVNMTERFLGKGEELARDRILKLEGFVRDQLSRLGWLDNARGLPVVGLGGSIRTLAKINKRAGGYFLEGLHNYRMEPVEVVEVYRKVTNTETSERKEIPGLQKDRADIIAGGLVPLKVLMEYINSEKLIISGNGLREGVFYKYYLKKLGFGDEIIPDVLHHSIFNTLKKYDVNIQHSRHICKLALEMFDQLKGMHGLGKDKRKLLEAGALLHDIGLYVDYYNHHSHGFYLTLNSNINGVSNKELVLCAFVTAMHRNESFKKNWNEYKMYISKEDYEVIRKLSIFVRIAEELDKNDYGSVEGLQCTCNENKVVIRLVPAVRAETWSGFELKSEKDFRKLFGRNIALRF
ncbi:MAG: HD domain-containing protein [Clostridiaceae bacterium]